MRILRIRIRIRIPNTALQEVETNDAVLSRFSSFRLRWIYCLLEALSRCYYSTVLPRNVPNVCLHPFFMIPSQPKRQGKGGGIFRRMQVHFPTES
jgi:hypothetical protein